MAITKGDVPIVDPKPPVLGGPKPDQSLPGEGPTYPDNTLPPSPDQGLPEPSPPFDGLSAKEYLVDKIIKEKIEEKLPNLTEEDKVAVMADRTERNVPPSVMSERLRNGQNPWTGEPWSRDQRMEYDRKIQQEREAHKAAIRESEVRMSEERAKAAEKEVATQREVAIKGA